MNSVLHSIETDKHVQVKQHTQRTSLRTIVMRRRWGNAAAERCGELEALRRIATLAATTFDHEGDGAVLIDALKSLSEDLKVLADASMGGSMALDEMVFERMRHRIDLALAVDEYRSSFDRKSGASQ